MGLFKPKPRYQPPEMSVVTWTNIAAKRLALDFRKVTTGYDLGEVVVEWPDFPELGGSCRRRYDVSGDDTLRLSFLGKALDPSKRGVFHQLIVTPLQASCDIDTATYTITERDADDSVDPIVVTCSLEASLTAIAIMRNRKGLPPVTIPGVDVL